MSTLRISQVAAQTGFSASTLRFYDQAGLVTPARGESGYREYDPGSVETLRFVARAKRFGLTLPEIAELVELFDGDRCEPVQARLSALVAGKIADAQRKVAELGAFVADLRAAETALAGRAVPGPCDDGCGCSLEVEPPPRQEVPVVCTLPVMGPDGMNVVRARLAEWQQMLADATDRQPLSGGIRVALPHDIAVGRLAELVAAEHDCCRFLEFRIEVATEGVALEITGPREAAGIIAALVGPVDLRPSSAQEIPLPG
jgi:DNA-binding transcriptional MerR regulator